MVHDTMRISHVQIPRNALSGMEKLMELDFESNRITRYFSIFFYKMFTEFDSFFPNNMLLSNCIQFQFYKCNFNGGNFRILKFFIFKRNSQFSNFNYSNYNCKILIDNPFYAIFFSVHDYNFYGLRLVKLNMKANTL